MALLVVEQGLAQGGVGGLLTAGLHGGVDAVAGGVGLLPVLLEHRRAHHLGDVMRLDLHLRRVLSRQQRLGQRLPVGGLGDEAQLAHAPQHIVAAVLGGGRVDQRVVARGRLGQAGEHRGFRQRQLVQRLAEVDVGGGGDAVGTAAEEDAVEVDLEDALLVQLALHLPRQQDLLDLALVAALGREEDIARQLHGDGRAALALLAGGGELERRAHQAEEIDAAVLEEAVVLGGQEGLQQRLGELLVAQRRATLGTELAHALALGAEHQQRCAEIGFAQALDRGQLRFQAGDLGPDEQPGTGGGDQEQGQQHQAGTLEEAQLIEAQGGSSDEGSASLSPASRVRGTAPGQGRSDFRGARGSASGSARGGAGLPGARPCAARGR